MLGAEVCMHTQKRKPTRKPETLNWVFIRLNVPGKKAQWSKKKRKN